MTREALEQRIRDIHRMVQNHCSPAIWQHALGLLVRDMESRPVRLVSDEDDYWTKGDAFSRMKPNIEGTTP